MHAHILEFIYIHPHSSSVEPLLALLALNSSPIFKSLMKEMEKSSLRKEKNKEGKEGNKRNLE